MTVSGVKGEERHNFTKAESKQIRARSLRLLGSLLLPVRAKVVLAMLVVVVSTAAQVSGPALIAVGIDRGLPARSRHGHPFSFWTIRCRRSM